jgi:predicted dehydrogenase
MSEKTYRGAVIGLGIMGEIADGLGGRSPEIYPPCNHADAYEMHPKVDLVAGATRDPDRQARFRTKRDKAVYGDYRQMLEKEQPDLVSIATPATVHAEMVIAAAEAGVKAIWCEKAMAVSLDECERMIAACAKSGTVLCINHQRRWDDRYRALRRLLDGGEIGKLQAIQIHFGRGRLCRGGSHAFDLALFFAQEDIAWGLGWLSDPGAFDPSGTGVFETKSGVRITIDGALGMQHRYWVELVGDEGILKLFNGDSDVQLWTPDEREHWREFNALSQRLLPTNYPIRSPFLNAVDDMIHCVENSVQPQSSGRDGLTAFEMIVAIHLSHRGNKQVIEFPVAERGFEIPSN